jgi:light-regulated signal transduction histidine kinase (bacteriophytochrome)
MDYQPPLWALAAGTGTAINSGGNDTTKSLPSPSTEFTVTLPPIRSAAFFTMAKPTPAPWKVSSAPPRSTSLWDKRGNLSGFAKVTRDLTQRKREEEALRRRTDELEAFAHTLSHDLRAPLRSVLSFTEILRKDRKDLSPDEQSVYLEKILSAAKSMDTLMTEILKLSQLSLEPAPEDTVPLDDVMDEAVRMLESEVKAMGAAIEIHKPLSAVYANRILLLQIFSNLIGNALKFAQRGEAPRIEVHNDVMTTFAQKRVRSLRMRQPSSS